MTITVSSVQVKNKEHFESTSIHGVRFILGHNRKYFFIWLIVSVASLSGLFYLCENSIKLYLQNNVTTTFVYNTLQKSDFPAISICSQNLVQRNVAGSISSFGEILSLMDFFNKPDPKQIVEVRMHSFFEFSC